jgi:hypothetical protein
MSWLTTMAAAVAPTIFEPAGSTSAPAQPAAREDLQDVLLDLAKWGQPRVGQYISDGTWYCSVEVNVTPVGVKFEAKSDFKQKTPLDAALMCRKNLREAVKMIGGNA